VRHLALLIALAACHDPVTKSAAPQPTALPGIASSDPLAWVPADSDLVMRIDVASLRKSPLWPKYAATVREVLTPSFIGCNYDPLAEVSSVSVGIPMNAAELGIFVVRGADRAKTLQCLHTSTTISNETVTFDGDYVTLTNKSGAVNIFTFVDDKTLVMQGSKNPTKQTLAAALQIGAPLRQDTGYLELEKKLRPGAVLTMVARPNATALLKKIEDNLGAPTRGFYAWFHVADRVESQVTIELATAQDAAAVAERMQPQLEMTKNFIDRLEAHATGATLTLDIAITEAQIKQIVAMVKPMLQGAGATP
jgi:hypothetical protein